MIYRRLFGFPSYGYRSSLDELDRMRRQIERFYEEATTPFQRPRAGVFPLINLSEDKSNYYVRAELPGVKAADLDIQATSNNLAIAGERKIPAEEEGARYHRREREAGSFSRMINLPGAINTAGVTASLENGVLTVIVPKAEIAKPRQITVK
jgi:HSP20 family protein